MDHKGKPIREFASPIPEITLDKKKDEFPDYGAPLPTYEDEKIDDDDSKWKLIGD
jgi:hypothetical protein